MAPSARWRRTVCASKSMGHWLANLLVKLAKVLRAHSLCDNLSIHYSKLLVFIVGLGWIVGRAVRAMVSMVVAIAAVGGVASAVAGGAEAAPNSFADRSVSKVTADGWRITATKAGERIRSVPPLNQSPWTREGFLSLDGEASISGSGKVAVTAGTVSSGWQLGCNTDVTSGVTLGVTAGPTAQMSITYPPALVLGAQVLPNISATLKPGTIADIPFGTKKLATSTAGTELDDVHVKVDGCLGPVSLRAYVTVAVSTPTHDTTINVYGQPHYL
ncbi:MspA family porin [Gordonia otitidis]|uniref:MspA family porin n=1 Tax=Gordonia otitidis TaxID=249058 RepID=UPI001D143550|nr:MspA family porin [Gordonia otitidis]UEA60039.1 MspA family porin [Gordonia otitidis]